MRWAALLALVWACANEGPSNAPPTELDGAEIYAEQCARCHGAVGQGRRGPPVTGWTDTREALVEVIDETMPFSSPRDCRGACAEVVADYVLTLDGVLQCDDIEPTPRRLRLLTRREYAAAVRDLLAPAFVAEPVADPCVDGTTFRYTGSASTVHLAGSFNDWNPTAWPMENDGDAWTTTRVIAEGSYEYKFVIDGSEWITDPANPERADDGFGGFNSVVRVTCASGGMSPSMVDDVAAGFPVENRPEGHPFDNAADLALVTTVHAQEYADAAKRLAESLGDGVSRLCDGCDDDELVRTFGRRAFRRPLTDAELTRYSAFGSDWRTIVRAMLSSPSFLYRSETGVVDGRLDGFEMASALSFTLWGTTPDDALLDAAASGELDATEGVRTHVERLLADPRARELVGDFAVQWLGLEALPELPRTLDGAAREAMLEETRSFVEQVVFDGTGRFDELLTSGGAGVLGQTSVHVRYAHSDQSSPIQRGVFVRRRILCQEFAPPPPDAGGVPDVDPEATTRERFRQHTESERCASCHQYIDDLGFAFERFDENGQSRESEAGGAIDSSGVLRDVEGFGTDTEDAFASLEELAGLLADSNAARDCFARQWYRFTFGAADREEDECTVRRFAEGFAASEGNIRELIVDLLTSESFRVRGSEVSE